MFYEFQNMIYSSANCVITDNTDFSVSGSSKKIEFPSEGDELSIGFTSVDISGYDEISMQLYTTPNVGDKRNIITITIGTDTFSFDATSGKNFNHILFDALPYTAIDEIKITSNVDGLVIFLDVIGYRQATFENVDKDVLKALADHISLDFGQETTLRRSASSGSKQIYLTSRQYIFPHTRVLLSDTEEVDLVDRSGKLKTELTTGHSSGASVKIQVPVLWGNYKKIDNDPVCGILIYDRDTRKTPVHQQLNGVGKKKWYLGNIYILIYIECSSENKLLQVARQYEFKYGEQFSFLLDGQVVEISIEGAGEFSPSMIGNKPRMAYRYVIQPQPCLKSRRVAIDSLTLTMGSGTI